MTSDKIDTLIPRYVVDHIQSDHEPFIWAFDDVFAIDIHKSLVFASPVLVKIALNEYHSVATHFIAPIDNSNRPPSCGFRIKEASIYSVYTMKRIFYGAESRLLTAVMYETEHESEGSSKHLAAFVK